MNVKKLIAILCLFLVFMQSLAGSIIVHFTQCEIAVASIADIIPAESEESEDGIEKEGTKELFPFKNIDWDWSNVSSQKNFTGEHPVKSPQIGYANIQNPPPDSFLG